MTKLYFISPSRLNASLQEIVTNQTIVIDGYTYVSLSRPPRGKRILRKFRTEEKKERIIIYA